MTKKIMDRVVLILFIVMSIALYVSTADYSGIAKTTSAHYVKFLAIFIGVLSTLQLAINLFKEKRRDPLQLSEHLPRFLGLLVALVVFALLFERLGFFLSAGVFVPVVALMLGYRNYISIVVTTCTLLLFVYLIFVQLLQVNLPSFGV
jgi:putative tricarboxylic transport membrane protein